jgi:hypothetical protein
VYQTRVHHFGIRATGAADPFGYSGSEFGEIGVLYLGAQGFTNLNLKNVYPGAVLFIQSGLVAMSFGRAWGLILFTGSAVGGLLVNGSSSRWEWSYQPVRN